MKSLAWLLVFAGCIASGFCCGTTGTGAVTEPPPPPETDAPSTDAPSSNCGCQVACDFSKDSCSYKQSGASTSDNWKLSSTRSGNRDTGVAGPDQGSTQFFDVRPKPHSTSSITSADLNCPSPVNVLVRFWEDTNQMSLREGSSDQSVSRFGVDASDRQWNSKIIRIPANTKNLNFVCDNQGPNIGNCGINKITIVDDAGNDQCGGGGGGGSTGGTAAPGGDGGDGGDGGSAEQQEEESEKDDQERKRRARLHKRRRQRQRLRN